MKEIKGWLKVLALVLSGLILLQSCSLYRIPVTLEQAAQEGKPVKIITIDDKTYKYEYIGLGSYKNFERYNIFAKGSKFYGAEEVKGYIVRVPINTDKVEKVWMKKGIPAWVIVAGSLITAGIIIGVIHENTEKD
ncbi:hypothetical protein [Lentiprolixibacter aurantiacus]|uniref:Uncharacterized protein n=1 Tax=Lentiprolixibacter aurantiacus TaxID=2993939 RepID=A0AAE3MK33_9FLAO|nr:hypothetical protein [Lentiprolixibacter aurantiacus]MCX2718873.1 hypothetical protein [Lentiprolixibacter aurantiacus]